MPKLLGLFTWVPIDLRLPSPFLGVALCSSLERWGCGLNFLLAVLFCCYLLVSSSSLRASTCLGQTSVFQDGS